MTPNENHKVDIYANIYAIIEFHSHDSRQQIIVSNESKYQLPIMPTATLLNCWVMYGTLHVHFNPN